jgi:c-di-GMP-binding flagellar brake protein YcgR
MKEQRRYVRHDLEGQVSLNFEMEGSVNLRREDDLSHIVKADLQDISYGGISIWASEKMEVGLNVFFELVTKFWEEPITGKGKVRYAREMKRYGSNNIRMGLEFTDVNRETIKLILSRILEEICEAARKKQPKKYF